MTRLYFIQCLLSGVGQQSSRGTWWGWLFLATLQLEVIEEEHGSHHTLFPRGAACRLLINGQIILNSGISVPWESLCSKAKHNSNLFRHFIWLFIVIGEKFERAASLFVMRSPQAICTPRLDFIGSRENCVWIYHCLFKSFQSLDEPDTHSKNPGTAISDVYAACLQKKWSQLIGQVKQVGQNCH